MCIFNPFTFTVRCISIRVELEVTDASPAATVKTIMKPAPLEIIQMISYCGFKPASVRQAVTRLVYFVPSSIYGAVAKVDDE